MESSPYQERKKLGGATVLLIVTLFLSNILGMLRDRVLVTLFPTYLLDTYYAAFQIPDLIYSLLVWGALSSAIIPIFSTYIAQKREEEAFRIINSIINLGLLSLVGIALLVAIFIPLLVHFITPGFEPERMQLVINLTRIMLVCPIFFGLSGVFGSVLNSFKKFFIYSLTPIIYNLSIIFGALVFARLWGIYGLALGVVLGAFLHMAIQIPPSCKLGFRYQLVLNLKDEGLRKIGRFAVPIAISLGAQRLIWVFNTVIGSLLKAGSIAVINLANNIQTLPSVVFGISISTAIFPSLSEKAALSRTQEFINHLSWGIRQILFLIIPATFGLILIRAQTVRIILGSYKFTWIDTMLTAACLGVFTISLFAQSLAPLITRAFYALHDVKTPVVVSVFSVLLNIVLAVVLTHHIFIDFYKIILRMPEDGRVIGLALAFSISSIIYLGLLLFYLRKKIGSLDEIVIFTSFFKILFASLVMAFATYLTLHLVAPLVNMQTFWGIVIQTASAIGVAVIVYFGLAFLLKLEEMAVFKLLTRRLLYSYGSSRQE